MFRIKTLFLILGVAELLFSLSCTKDRVGNPKDVNPDSVAAPPGLKINEFVATGSTLVNELGVATDWIEFYNNADDSLSMDNGQWFITDDFTDKTKFELPKAVIPARAFFLVFCDDSNKVLTQIHTNFGLSKNGEQIGIYYIHQAADTVTVDSIIFGPQNDNISEGRYPDGADNWTFFSPPTPGQPNK